VVVTTNADHSTTLPPGPLAGLRILDLCGEEGQLCGRLLAGLGGDVIKVEPPGGDPVRSLGPWYHDRVSRETSLRWFAMNVGKRSIVVDLEADEGRSTFKQLAAVSHAVIESFTPGHMASVGLGYEALNAVNPALVYTSITGYGQSGPYRDLPWSDITALAMGGVLWIAGDEDRPPLRMSPPQAYFHVSMQAAIGTLLALFGSGATGRGQQVDAAAQAALTISLEGPGGLMNVVRMSGHLPRRLGVLREPTPGFRFPVVLPCKDGTVAVATVLGQALPRWLAAMGEDGMQGDLTDERWETASFIGTAQPGQWVPSPEDIVHVYGVVTAWTRSHTKAEIEESARRHHFMAGPQNTVLEILASEQLRARGFFEEVSHPELDDALTYLGAPFKMNRSPWRSGPRPPLIGEHTAEVFAECGIAVAASVAEAAS
jgi:crotonobetainyl-CoA:carnitine CoA-transferase CaiB-like acyl-CoA transferase